MARLTDLPNIGPKLAGHLEQAGLSTPEAVTRIFLVRQGDFPVKRRKTALLALSPPQVGHGSHTDVWQGKATQYGGKNAGQTACCG